MPLRPRRRPVCRLTPAGAGALAAKREDRRSFARGVRAILRNRVAEEFG